MDKVFRDLFTFWHLFTMSETELDYYHQRVIVRVALRVVEQLKTSGYQEKSIKSLKCLG